MTGASQLRWAAVRRRPQAGAALLAEVGAPDRPGEHSWAAAAPTPVSGPNHSVAVTAPPPASTQGQAPGPGSSPLGAWLCSGLCPDPLPLLMLPHPLWVARPATGTTLRHCREKGVLPTGAAGASWAVGPTPGS